MGKKEFDRIRCRVNKAFNFWADTKDVDYVLTDIDAAFILAEDADNRKLVLDFPELRRLGY